MWERSTLTRAVLLTATYAVAIIVIALFMYINILYSIRFSADDNHAWLVTMLTSVILGERAAVASLACFAHVIAKRSSYPYALPCIADALVIQPAREMVTVLSKFLWGVRVHAVDKLMISDVMCTQLLEKAHDVILALADDGVFDLDHVPVPPADSDDDNENLNVMDDLPVPPPALEAQSQGALVEGEKHSQLDEAATAV